MKIRLITGTAYVAVLVAFYLLKIFVHDFFFDALVYAFALIGTFEMLRAMKEKTTKAERAMVFIFAIVCIPACAVAEYFFRYGLHVTSICFFALAVALVSLLVIRHEETNPENLGVSFLSAVYPVLLLCIFILTNHVSDPSAMETYPETLKRIAFDSDLLILFIFVVSPCSDSFAYVFGRFLGKFFPRKMAPSISPNKTLIGAVGGLLGGIVGSIVLCVIWYYVKGLPAPLWEDILFFTLVGLLCAAATEIGDLAESAIKRKAGIKDMGKIMPGHGGILDRIDGTMLVTIVIYLIFVLIPAI